MGVLRLLPRSDEVGKLAASGRPVVAAVTVAALPGTKFELRYASLEGPTGISSPAGERPQPATRDPTYGLKSATSQGSFNNTSPPFNCLEKSTTRMMAFPFTASLVLVDV